MRLNRYLAASGLGSRRACEQLIVDGKVSMGGHFLRDLATQVGEDDVVHVSGKVVRPPPSPTVIALYKPRGFLTTRSDERKRRTLYDLLPKNFARLSYIGRLDKDSEGLVLLTDDGALSHSLTHPSRKAEKEYEVILDKALDPQLIPKLLKGFQIEGGRARMDAIHPIAPAHVRVILTQGLNRQIRQMFFRVGLEVKRLIRTRVGPITLSPLHPGEWRKLRTREMASLGGKGAAKR